MKNLLIILFCLIWANHYAQDTYPTILNFEVNNNVTTDDGKTIGSKDAYHFLMLNAQKAIDLKKYGNQECEFKISASNANRILLEFNQPSKLIPKGMCAAGLEMGFLYLELDNNADVIKSNFYVTESCLWSIEIMDTLYEGSDKIKYVCENLQTSESYIISIELSEVTISKEVKH